MKVLIVIFLLLSLLLETSVSFLPLVFIVLLSAALAVKEDFILVFAAVLGMLLDILTLKPVGFSSIFFITFIYLLYIYENKLETTNYVVAAFGFSGSFLYLLITKGDIEVLSSLICASLGVLLFTLFNKLKTRPIPAQNSYSANL